MVRAPGAGIHGYRLSYSVPDFLEQRRELVAFYEQTTPAFARQF
jgi:hypothetical protein